MKFYLRHYLTIAFTTVTAIPVLILGAWVHETSMDKELNAVSEKHLLLANSTTESLNRYAQTSKLVFNLLLETLEYGSSPASIELAQKIGFRHISILDQQGRQISQMKIEEGLNETVHEPTFSTLFRQSDENVRFSGVMADPHGKPTLYLSKRLGFNQVAIGALNLDYIRAIQSAILFGRNGHSAIVDHLGHIMAHPLPEWQQQMKNVSEVKPVEMMMAGRSGVIKFFSPASNSDMITGYAVVPSTNWGVMVPQPLAELKERAGDVKQMVLALILIGLVVAALISWILAGFLVRPVEAVIEASRKFSRGYLDVHVPAPSGRYPMEFQELGLSVNSMIRDVGTGIIEREDGERELQISNEQLNHLSQKLTSLNLDLESRIDERTDDLKQQIARQKELQVTLQASQQRFKDFAEAGADWFWETDEHLCWKYLSEGYTTRTGTPPEQLLGRTLGETMNDVEDKNLLRDFIADLGACRPIRNFGYRIKHPKGHALYVRISASPIFDSTGKFEGYRGIGLEITDWMTHIGQKTSLHSKVSLELRRSLSSTQAALERLTSPRDGFQSENAKGLIARIRNNNEQLLDIIDKMIDTEKFDSDFIYLNPKPLELSQLVAKTVSSCAQLGDKYGVKFILLDQPSSATVQGDATRLVQMITNLLSNAAKFSPRGGKVEVSVISENETVNITVSDTGPGIANEYRDQVFQRFFQTGSPKSRANEGLGLGLYIAKCIAKQHGGDIDYLSEPNIRTTFIITLPQVKKSC